MIIIYVIRNRSVSVYSGNFSLVFIKCKTSVTKKKVNRVWLEEWHRAEKELSTGLKISWYNNGQGLGFDITIIINSLINYNTASCNFLHIEPYIYPAISVVNNNTLVVSRLK